MEKSNRRLCNPEHEHDIVALCKFDQLYVCNECLKADHLEHQRVFVSTLAKNTSFYAQEVANSAEDALKNCKYIFSTLDKEEIINSIKNKIEEAFEEAIHKITMYRDKLLEDMLSFGVLKEIIQSSQEMQENNNALITLKQEIESAQGDIKELLARERYVEVINVQPRLGSYDAHISDLAEKINVGTIKLQNSMQVVEALPHESVITDSCLETILNPGFFNALRQEQSGMHKSFQTQSSKKSASPERPDLVLHSERPEPFDRPQLSDRHEQALIAGVGEALNLTLSQTLDNLLIKIENTHGREISIFNLSLEKGFNFKFNKDFKLPLNFAVIEKVGGKEVYITGGWHAGKYRNSNFEYSLVQGSVIKKADMKTCRRSHAGVFCKDAIVCGGENSLGYLNKCEAYNEAKNEWELISSLNECKSYSSACSMANTKVYLFGGYTHTNGVHKNFDTIEVLDYKPKETWKIVKVTKKGTWSACQDVGSVAVSDTQILIFGGYKGSEITDSMLFNTTTCAMENTGRLPKPDRFYHRTAKVFDDKVYVMSYKASEIWFCDLKSMKWATLGEEGEY